MITRKQHGFTIIELMVVIGIIAIIIAIALPNLAGAIERGRLAQLKKNMDNFRLLLENHHIDHGVYPVYVQELNRSPYDTELIKFDNPFHLAGDPAIGDIFGMSMWLIHVDAGGGLDLGRGSVVLTSMSSSGWYTVYKQGGSTAKYYQGTVFYYPYDNNGNLAGAPNFSIPAGANLAAIRQTTPAVAGYGMFALDGGGNPIPNLVYEQGMPLP